MGAHVGVAVGFLEGAPVGARVAIVLGITVGSLFGLNEDVVGLLVVAALG